MECLAADRNVTERHCHSNIALHACEVKPGVNADTQGFKAGCEPSGGVECAHLSDYRLAVTAASVSHPTHPATVKRPHLGGELLS